MDLTAAVIGGYYLQKHYAWNTLSILCSSYYPRVDPTYSTHSLVNVKQKGETTPEVRCFCNKFSTCKYDEC